METKEISLGSPYYDPSKTSVIFDGYRIDRFSQPLKYRRVDHETHELYLQATSQFLKGSAKGNTGIFTIGVHAGKESTLTLDFGRTQISDIFVKELTGDVPTVVVVLKSI